MAVQLDYSKFLTDSGFAGSLGITVECAECGHCILSMKIKEEHLNPLGKAHGGVTFSLLDTAAGIASEIKEDGIQRLVSINGNIHYLHPVSVGTLKAEGRIIKDGTKTAVAEARAFGEDGIEYALATFDLFYI